MLRQEHGLGQMKSASLEVQFAWTMGIMAKTLGITKKSLRKAKKIIDAKRFKDEIMVKGKPVKMIFARGFYSFILKEKNKSREILAPHPNVQAVLEAIKDWLVELAPAHKNAYGFVKKRNVQMAVESLLGNSHFFSFDIADAFPSITVEMVEQALGRLEINEALIAPLAWLATYNYNGHRRLPQGSSCSPVLLNLVYESMCQEIDRVCQAHSLSWFVYADDFNFAGAEITPEAKEELLAIPAKHGFFIKKKKNKDNLGKTIPHMLGLTVVDGKIHIRRGAKNKFRRRLYMAWKYGAYSRAQALGIAAAIRQTYGQEKDWPGWLRKYWVKYQEKNSEGRKKI